MSKIIILSSFLFSQVSFACFCFDTNSGDLSPPWGKKTRTNSAEFKTKDKDEKSITSSTPLDFSASERQRQSTKAQATKTQQ